MDIDVIEQSFGDILVASFGKPFAFEITPAQVHRNRHSGGPVGERIVDQIYVGLDQTIRVLAARRDLGADIGIAQHGEGNLVDLDIGRAPPAEIGNFGLIDFG